MNRDLEYLLSSSFEEIQSEYKRIYADTKDDPGTAGDEGEGNWAKLMRDWLPSNFIVRTKGRIMNSKGQKSPQVDVIVLRPDYPLKLQDKHTFMLSGVIAAFECKNTLKSNDLKKFITNSKVIKALSQPSQGTIYGELHSSIIYGLLCHSHSWKKPSSKPKDNVINGLIKNSNKFLDYPYEYPDLICVSDLGFWSTFKSTIMSKVTVGYMDKTLATNSEVKNHFPIGSLTTSLYNKIAREIPSVRPFAGFLSSSMIGGHGNLDGRTFKYEDVLSKTVIDRAINAPIKISRWDENSLIFD